MRTKEHKSERPLSDSFGTEPRRGSLLAKRKQITAIVAAGAIAAGGGFEVATGKISDALKGSGNETGQALANKELHEKVKGFNSGASFFEELNPSKAKELIAESDGNEAAEDVIEALRGILGGVGTLQNGAELYEEITTPETEEALKEIIDARFIWQNGDFSDGANLSFKSYDSNGNPIGYAAELSTKERLVEEILRNSLLELKNKIAPSRIEQLLEANPDLRASHVARVGGSEYSPYDELKRLKRAIAKRENAKNMEKLSREKFRNSRKGSNQPTWATGKNPRAGSFTNSSRHGSFPPRR